MTERKTKLSSKDLCVCIVNQLYEKLAECLREGINNDFKLSNEVLYTLEFIADAVDCACETIERGL